MGGENILTLTDHINAVNEANVLVKTDFEGGELDLIPEPWHTFSVASDAEWWIDIEEDRAGAVISGFATDSASEDWLLSPPLAVSATDIPVITADFYTNFDGPLLDILVSSDYTSGAPNDATWSSLNADLSGLPERAWTEVGDLSLAGLSGDLTVAFKYVSTGVGSGDGRTYGVDNVMILKETAIPALSGLSFAISTSNATTKDPISFRPFITGGKHLYTYTWEFSDGTTSDAQTPAVTFATAGLFDVNLTVTDA
ncbi:MAG: hypothetical protein ACI9DF_005653 [Verrucomicrobiales bacterium]